jgi:hypothetical protein
MARLVGWAQLWFFALYLAWFAFEETNWSDSVYFWMLRHHWQMPVTMPEGPNFPMHVVLPFVMSIPLFLIFLLLARLATAEVLLRVFAGGFALIAFPLFTLYHSHASNPAAPPYPPFGNPSVVENAHQWSLETLVFLALGVFYYLRPRSVPWGLGIVLLVLHFGFWASAAELYRFAPLRLYAPYRYPLIVLLMDYTYFCAFPVIGFLSALSSFTYLKLSFDQPQTRSSIPGRRCPPEL